MRLASLLHTDHIHVGGDFKDREAAIAFLVDNVARHLPPAVSKETALKAVLDREALGGTLHGGGISLPHARLDNFEDLLVAVCIPRNPLPADPEPIRIIILMLTDKAASSLYLHTLAAFAKLLRTESYRDRALSAPSPDAFIGVVRDSALEVRKSIRVRDIMTADVAVVGPDTTVREVADLFYTRGLTYVPVADSAGNLLGEVDINDILGVGMPNYATMLGNLKFVRNFEPLEYLLKNEDRIRVSELMKKPKGVLTPDASIVEAVFLLTTNRRRAVPVAESGRLVGVVSVTDLLNKVLRV